MNSINDGMTRERLVELTGLINAYDKEYYENDNSLVTNAEYDRLKHELEAIERLHPDWILPESPSKKPGGNAGKDRFKVRHEVKLLSLQDYFTLEDLESWYESIGNPVVTVEEKIDGLTMALTYIDGELQMAATRGDGEIGEVITENALLVKNVPHKLPLLPGVEEHNKLIVRVEVYQPVAEFERCNEELLAAGKEPFSNPRNAASGGLRAKTAKECQQRGLAAFAFRILYAEGWDAVRDAGHEYPFQSDDLVLLGKLGFQRVPYYKCRNFFEITAAIEAIGQRRNALPYWTDGAVIKTNDRRLAEALGAGSKYPVHSAAYKYPAEAVETTIREIKIQTGRTGVLTPVAIFDPVQIAGTTVTNATCHNQKYLTDNKIGPGAVVKIIKSGEIIPKVESVVTPAPETYEIKSCPVCGATAIERLNDKSEPTGVMLCPNKAHCSAQALRYLEFFCSKDVMDIRGLGPEMLKKLWDANLVRNPVDIYELPDKLDKIAALPKCGMKTAQNIAKAIENSKNNDIDRLIKALGIPGVGRHTGRALAAKYDSIGAILDLTDEQLLAIDGVGEITLRDIRAYFGNPENIDFVEALLEHGVNMKSLSRKAGTMGIGAEFKPINGMTIVVTGTIDGYTRGDIEDFIRANGGIPSGSVSKKTTYVVAGANAGSKLKKARDLGINVIDIKQLEAMCGKGE